MHAIASAYLNLPGPVVLAHRGFDLAGAENTMRAFRAAVDLGARYLETDVHLSRDGVVVAFHDDVLDRVSDASGPLRQRTWAQLCEVRVAGEAICRFSDLLTEFPASRFNIDVKSAEVARPLAQVLLSVHRRQGDLLERVCIASFSDARRRAALAALPPGVCSSAGPLAIALLWQASRPWRRRRPRVGRVTARSLRGVRLVQVPEQYGPLRVLDEAFLRCAHRHGLAVHVWTVNDEHDMRRLLSAGVDGLVSDRCDIALHVTRTREANP